MDAVKLWFNSFCPLLKQKYCLSEKLTVSCRKMCNNRNNMNSECPSRQLTGRPSDSHSCTAEKFHICKQTHIPAAWGLPEHVGLSSFLQQALYLHTMHCLSPGTASLSLLSSTLRSEIIYSIAGLSATSHYMARTLSQGKGWTGALRLKAVIQQSSHLTD